VVPILAPIERRVNTMTNTEGLLRLKDDLLLDALIESDELKRLLARIAEITDLDCKENRDYWVNLGSVRGVISQWRAMKKARE
jgi:hypothetical protein